MLYLNFVIGVSIFLLFALRPFVYKKASRDFSADISCYFTSVWCFLFALLSLPFCYNYFFINGKLVVFKIGFIFPILKGISLYFFMKYNQLVNKENTSCSVFWGMISLGIATLVSTVVFEIPLDTIKQRILISIAILSLLFFSFGEGKKLTKFGKKAFLYTILFASINNICDVLGIRYTNWYVMYFFTIFLMLLFSIIIASRKISVLNFFTKKIFCLAGIIFALGEVFLMFSMQYFFPVVVALFIVRVSQSFDLIIAHYVEKEGKITTQYLFAIGMILISYFFFFGK